MKRPLITLAALSAPLLAFSFWGFFAHQKINQLAVFCLPPDMIGYYKKNINFITEAAVNPDKRRHFSPDEPPRHYIDLDHYGDSGLHIMPKYWNEAVLKFSEDTLKAYGIVPWHINKMFYRLRDAFAIKNSKEILRLSAEIGHYVADAHVPLHTTENYNGQLTQQHGIHAFWESRLPELFSADYNFFVGRARYITNVQLEAWNAVASANAAVDSVLGEEKALAAKYGEKKYSFETKGKQVLKVYAYEYAREYHKLMDGMVERQMRRSVLMISSLWYTAWVDAGQPDLKSLIASPLSEEEIAENKKVYDAWKTKSIAGDHDQ